MSLHEDMLALYASERTSKAGKGLSPSDVGALFDGGCQRALAYREQGHELADPEPEHLTRAALLGEAAHDVAARARRLAGWELVEDFVILPGLDRRGKVDGYRDGVVDDVKSKSANGMRAIRDRGKAYEGDAAQVDLYALAIELSGRPVTRCQVTYVGRDDGDVFEDSWTYDRGHSRQLLRELAALTELIRSVPPERIPRGGRRHNARPCDGCPFRTECWDLDAVLPEGQNPTSAKLGTEEVQQTARDLHRLRAEKTELEEAIEWCRTALAGHSGEQFTDSEGILRRIHWTQSKPEGGALDQRRAAELLAEMGITPPRLGTVSQLRTPAV